MVIVNKATRESRPLPALLWILIVGAGGFLTGFVGSMIVAPVSGRG